MLMWDFLATMSGIECLSTRRHKVVFGWVRQRQMQGPGASNFEQGCASIGHLFRQNFRL